MRNLLTLMMILTFSLFTSCEKDDDAGSTPEDTRVLFIIGSEDELTLVSQTDETIIVSIHIEITNVLESTYLVNTNISDIPISLNRVGATNVFSRTHTLLRENFPEATEYYIRFSSPDDYLESNIITIDFGDGSVGGIDLETIYIANVIQESFSNETITTQINFANNSLNGGQLVARLFYNGTPLGENTVNCIGQSGPTNSSFTHSQIQGNRTYQMLFENTDIDDPIYAFVDSTGEVIMGTNDEPVSSIVLEFTSSETTATVVNQTPNIGPDTISLDSEISTNSNVSQNIRVKLFPQGSTAAIFTSLIIPTPAGGGNLFINDLSISGLNPGSHYDLKYFLNDNELPFADYSLTTLSAGSFNVGFGVINEEVNGGEVQIIWGNQSGMDVEGEWKFSGIDLDGNNRVLVQPITFTNGLINQASTELQNGFKQNSSLNVSIEINGVSFITTSFITNTIQYSDFQNLNINDPSTPVDLFPSEENINRTKVMVNASGEGQVRQVLFRLTDTNGLNLNNYPDNWSFDGSANFDLTFSETIPGSGIWEATLSITEDISAGSNTYLIGIGTENYTVSTPGMSDNFDLQVLLIDDDNKVVGDTANSIGLQFNE